MTLETILEYALPLALVLLAIVAVWLVVEAALTMRSTRSALNTMQEQLKPTLEKVNDAADALVPAVQKIDPLMERVNLSVDAVNLEIMRVDTILEEAGEITKNLNQASEAATTLVCAPQEAVNQVSSRVRNALKPRAASDESMAIGRRREAAAKEAEKPADAKQVMDAVKAAVSPMAAAMQDGTAQEAAEKKVAAAVERINAAARSVKESAQEAAANARAAKVEKSANPVNPAKSAASGKDEGASSPGYFTYGSDVLAANEARMSEQSE